MDPLAVTRAGDKARRWPGFAIAFAVYPVLYIAATNPGQVAASSVLLAAGIAAAGAAILLVGLRGRLGTWLRAGVAVSWAVFLFFSYGAATGWVEDILRVPDELRLALGGCCDPRSQQVQSVAWLLLLALGWMAVRRLPAGEGRASGALNLVAGLLLASVAVQFVAHRAGSTESSGHVAAASRHAGAGAPDIYVIVLDGYARADVLRQYYRFDNEPFLEWLRARGFWIDEASTANYVWTDISLPSMLNMNFVPSLLGDAYERESLDRRGVYRLTRDNAVARFLRARGYRYVHLQSTWGATGANPYADEFLACQAGALRDDFLRTLVDTTWLRVFASRAALDVARCHLRNFDALAELARAPGPKFVFAHFMPPHHPYLFDREGRVPSHARLSDQFDFQNQLWELRGDYVEQLEFVNGRLQRVIERLIADSDLPPIVILQSDHGPSLRVGLTGTEHRRVRLANLSAVRLPDASRAMEPGMSSVNLFRQVLDIEFGAGLPLLPERHFTSSFERPFRFEEVTRDGQHVYASDR